MKRSMLLAIFCMLAMVGSVEARHHMGGHGGGMKGGCGMMEGGGMKGGGMMGGGGMKGCGMMGGGKGGHGGMHGAMGAFHHWMHRVMMHREALDLTSDQIDRINEFSAAHARSAIGNRAEHQILLIDYRQALRKKSVDIKAVEKILKKQSDLHFRAQKEGLTFYTQVLRLLTPEQKEIVWETVGTIFPHAWDNVRHGGHHMQGAYPDYNGPPKPTPEMGKQN